MPKLKYKHFKDISKRMLIAWLKKKPDKILDLQHQDQMKISAEVMKKSVLLKILVSVVVKYLVKVVSSDNFVLSVMMRTTVMCITA